MSSSATIINDCEHGDSVQKPSAGRRRQTRRRSCINTTSPTFDADTSAGDIRPRKKRSSPRKTTIKYNKNEGNTSRHIRHKRTPSTTTVESNTSQRNIKRGTQRKLATSNGQPGSDGKDIMPTRPKKTVFEKDLTATERAIPDTKLLHNLGNHVSAYARAGRGPPTQNLNCRGAWFNAVRLYRKANEQYKELFIAAGFGDFLKIEPVEWVDLCQRYIVEARWFNNGHITSFNEYIEHRWMSCSAHIVITQAYFLLANPITEEALNYFENYSNFCRHAAMLCGLANDMGTSSHELERGDVQKAIQCYMHETGADEEAARDHMRGMMRESWKALNKERAAISSFLPKIYLETITNLARMTLYMYQGGSDGVGIQKSSKTKNTIYSLLIVMRMRNLFNQAGSTENVRERFEELYLHATTTMEETRSSIQIQCDVEVFGGDLTIFLLHENLIALFEFERIDQAVILAYMVYLHTVIRENEELEKFSFLYSGAKFYLKDDFQSYVVKRLRESNVDRIFFLPYNKESHWILTILWDGEIYLLNPLTRSTQISELEKELISAMKTFYAETGSNKLPKVKNLIGSPKQPGGHECGYVVMRYMKDIIEDKELSFPTKWMNNSRNCYTKEQLDEVRFEVLNYIQKRLILTL